ncbi:serine/threonine-protein phosphatase [Bosea caraganae]|uniref:Serine/threonine-protein phosphatase n=1 Tax=Bosea caraganae TaxID=2763117 RepID=A0A370L7R5_9HYPH|nr:PP2C family serine/threonine-protein phosphatase [Bosea caraganae]RDJ24975.1 serine/threonine-protein phosphatase [Bosea caraganae]RDJ26086.1 serine/threonine-protein phosphatase [Bosea caraganae]
MNELRPTMPAFETGAVSHAGRVRKANEDHLVTRPEFGLWAVADGMGGHENGALASATVAAALEGIGAASSAPDLLARLEEGVLKANAELREIIEAKGGAPMGSTLVVLLVHERHFACVWSGDSRIYLVRAGRILQVSHDHTEVQDMVDKGVLTPDEAKRSPRRHIITHAIGVHDQPELDLNNGELESGDTFVLCSDGLTEHVADEEILLAVREAAPQAACDALLALTLERGARDNVTVIVVRYQREDGEKTRWLPNMRSEAP